MIGNRKRLKSIVIYLLSKENIVKSIVRLLLVAKMSQRNMGIIQSIVGGFVAHGKGRSDVNCSSNTMILQALIMSKKTYFKTEANFRGNSVKYILENKHIK